MQDLETKTLRRFEVTQVIAGEAERQVPCSMTLIGPYAWNSIRAEDLRGPFCLILVQVPADQPRSLCT